jgi:hypothetical protein
MGTVKGHWDRIRFGENSRYLIIRIYFRSQTA